MISCLRFNSTAFISRTLLEISHVFIGVCTVNPPGAEIRVLRATFGDTCVHSTHSTCGVALRRDSFVNFVDDCYYEDAHPHTAAPWPMMAVCGWGSGAGRHTGMGKWGHISIENGSGTGSSARNHQC